MGYTEKQAELSSLFDPLKSEITLPGSGMKIYNDSFESGEMPEGLFTGSDSSITENRIFTYPVFVPPGPSSQKVILLLHGLNERSWIKYLAWAYFLSEATRSYVVLFPISFHINRSPGSWRDPRAMAGFLSERKKQKGDINKASFANVALSDRLTDDPRRFLKSGYQTVCDILSLLASIKTGKHRIIPTCQNVNIFAYSIGAFLAEIMMLSDPGNLLTSSKLFMFCGGSVFSNMNGESKLIMDKLAFDKVYNYYMDVFETDIMEKNNVLNMLASGNVGMAFRAMIDFRRLRRLRDSGFRKLQDRIYAVALRRDTVIPCDGIIKTVSAGSCIPGKNIEVWDFNYGYSHENPFPLLPKPLSMEVDSSFERLISRASLFL